MKNLKILVILIKTFGFKLKYLFLILVRFFIEMLINISLIADDIIFPKYKKVKLEKPVFLIGHPRSGTTFLHRFFEKNCSQIRTVYLWEMIFPSLLLRKIAGLFKKQLGAISLDKIWDPKIHKTSLLAAETEDIALFFRYFDGFLSWIYYSLWGEFKSDDEFYQKLIEKCNKDRFILYLKKLHQKNLINSNRKMFSKSFALLFNIETIKRVYPDARILLMIRDPLQSLASFMSLEKHTQNSLNKLYKYDKSLKDKYYKGIYLTSLYYYKKVEEIVSGLSEGDDSIKLITHKQLLLNFDDVMNEILIHFEIDFSEELKGAVAKQLLKQQTFQSEHKYSLEEFGFSAEQVRKDFAFVYEHFDV